jgi:hypothetical protein
MNWRGTGDSPATWSAPGRAVREKVHREPCLLVADAAHQAAVSGAGESPAQIPANSPIGLRVWRGLGDSLARAGKSCRG